MSRPESARRWLPAGALLLVAALLGAFIGYRGDHRGAPEPTTPSNAASSVPSGNSTPIEPVAGAEARRETPANAASEATGPGSLRIHVVDAVSKSAVAGAKGFVESPNEGAHDFGSFDTDSDGRAVVRSLPAATLVVHVLRRPPHASGYAAVELHVGETRDLEVSLTAGGTIVGRAIDDTGKGVADAEVSMGSDRDDVLTIGAPQTWIEIGKTGADGRFEIPNVQSRPVRASVVGGELRAQFWAAVSVRVRSGHEEGYAHETVADGTRVDVGDIVLPRARPLLGRVLDAHRSPVEGALVELAEWPAELKRLDASLRTSPASAVLGDGKALTKVDGSFALKANATAKYASVTTRSAVFEQFTLPEAKSAPAELELVLKDWSILEIELLDEQGARISSSPPRMRDRRVRMISAARQILGDASQLDATLVLDGRREMHQRFPADADGLFRFQTAGTSGLKRRLHFELPGYIAVDDEIGAQTEFLEHRQFTVHPIPMMRVHVNIAAQPEAKPGTRRRLLVQACMLDPAEYKARVKVPGIHCCGQGSVFTTALEAGEQDVELPVLAKGSYWLHAVVPSAKRNEKGELVDDVAFESHIGPFAADGTSHDVKVPAVELMAPVEDPIAAMPASSLGSTSMTGRIIDSLTQKGIDYAAIGMSRVPNPRGTIGDYNLGVDRDGVLKRHALRAGTYSMRLFVRKYRVPPAREVTIVDGQTLDLGTIALDPIPTTTLHVLEADGRPVPRGARVELFVAGQVGSLVQARIEDDEGKVALQNELGPGFTVTVEEDRPQSDIDGLTGKQWMPHDFSPDQNEVELRLQKWRPIEARVGGAIQGFPGAIVRLQIAPTGLDPDKWGRTNMTEVLADADGTRRFRADVGSPMKLQIAIRSTLLQPSVQTIDIDGGSDVQRISLSSMR